MGKNIHGGSGHKKFGRKFTSGSVSKNNRLKISEDPSEIYAIATKMLGSCMFHCHSIDGVTRLVHIRGKFAGRSKRDNLVECGKWVLIGLREWDSKSSSNSKNAYQQCDLLNVYNDLDKYRLRETIDANWSELDNNDVSRETQADSKYDPNDDVFGTEQDFERERLIRDMENTFTEKITLNVIDESKDDNENEIDIDDI
jgi:hypothetical protein